jgi:hypothetical protein
MPVIGYLVKALDSLPVYRRQDEGQDVTKNEETFIAARKLLARGGTIGICPEGVSHDSPGLRPIKTGAARISLAAISTGEVKELKIVPAGLYYTSKTSFRSSALLYFGTPINVSPVKLEPDGSPPRDAVRQLSQEIEQALRAVILDAHQEEARQTIARAERIFSNDGDSLKDELRLQQRFIKAYSILEGHQPERLRRLEQRMIRFEEELNQAGVDAEGFSPPSSMASVFASIAKRSLIFLLMLAPALLGTIAHYPAYRLGGYLATRFSRDSEDIISTIKIISAMLLFPLTWLVLAVASYVAFGWLRGWWAAAVVLVTIPLCGYVAMIFFEELDKSIAGIRVLTFFLVRRRFFVRLLAERKAIRNEIVSLGKESPVASE